MAAHVDQKRRVVDVRAFLLAQADTLGQAQGNHALAEDVLHWLAKTQVDPEGQSGYQLGKPHPVEIAPAAIVHISNASPARRLR